MTARAYRLLLFVVLIVASAARPAPAQTTLGRIVGTARDTSGAVLPGATVTLESRATGEKLATTTQSDGAFIFPQVRPGYYTVHLELEGFKQVTYNDVKVDPGQEYSLAAALDVGGLNEAVQVTAGVDLVHTTTPEVTNTVRQEQILELPLNARNPIELIRLQAGVPGVAARQSTAINGGRPTWTQTTQDGINIQDNFIRTNSLDFVPNRPTSDIVGEFTIVTNTQGVDSAGGASQVRMITPSGTNELHGSIYEFNRNSKFSANSWFNNRDKLEKPYLNRNQWGGRAGGPIMKGKLFYFGYYEKFSQKNEATPNNTIPLNDDYLTGTFRYRSPGSTEVRSVNLLNLSGLRLDPVVQQRISSRIKPASAVNNQDVGDGLNRAGYRFNQNDITTRHYVGGRVDYNMNASHQFEGTFTRLSDVDDRTDLDTVNVDPLVYTESVTKFFVGAWRWSATPRLQHEARFGGNLAPVAFQSDEAFGDQILGTSNLTSPIVTFQPQGRDTRTYQFIDTATYMWGDHTLQFGGSWQHIKVNPYNYAGRFPTVTFGFSAAAPTGVQLSSTQFPGGISANDLATANAHLAYLGGIVSQVAQTFQVQDRSSGFVAGIPEDRNLTFNNTNVYIQDNWRVKPGLTLRGGVKWEYFSPLREDDDLFLLPTQPNGQSTRDALLNPAGTVDFVNGGMYQPDRNNIGPTVGFAWDPSQNGRTAVRGAYTLAFVNEETLTVVRNAAIGNPGLTTAATLTNQYAAAGNGIPVVPTPAFIVPRTYAQQLGVSLTSAAFGVNSDIVQPKVHQFNLSVEREIGFDMAVEARYVGTLGRDIWRGIDYNQVSAQGIFLEDFLRARRNGFLSQGAGGAFDPAFNPNIPGSQPLTYLTQFGGGQLTNATVRNNIQTGQAGALADFYLTTPSTATAARSAFYANSGIYAADAVTNDGNTDYHALQLETRRRFKNGLFWQANYTFSKALSNSPGTAQARFEPFIDNNRQGIERTRTEFHVTHVLNANAIWELPFGQGHKWLDRTGPIDWFAGGWQVSGIVHLQSGVPFSILAARGTFNRAGRSAGNMAVTDLSRDELQALIGIFKQPDGRVFFIDPKVIDPATGRGVGTDTIDNRATFPGQVFFNPTAGEIGTLQRLSLDSPSLLTMDLSLSKRQRIGSRYSAEFKIEAFNLTNTPIFDYVDTDINSTTFGRVLQLEPNATGSRVLQLAVKFNF
jgi:carboxypeptidase family protein